MNSTVSNGTCELAIEAVEASLYALQDRRTVFFMIFWSISMLFAAFGAFHKGQQALAKRLRKLTPERAMEELLDISRS